MSKKFDYTALVESLKKSVSKQFNDINTDAFEERVLPFYPITEVRNGNIIIIWDNNDEQVWDHSEEDENIIEVAKELELELKAIKYVKSKLLREISIITQELQGFNVHDDHIKDIIYSAYSSLQTLLIEIDDTRSDKKEAL